MQNHWKAGLTYFAEVFVLAVTFGVVRVALVAPRLGELAAVAIEVPLLLVCAWVIAGQVLARGPLPLQGRLAMGAIAFGLLLLAEFALATIAFGRSATAFAASLATPPGLLGLAGQIGFAVIPALRQVRG